MESREASATKAESVAAELESMKLKEAAVSVNIFSTNYATFLPPFPLPHFRHSRYRRYANSGYRSGARSGCSSSLTSLSL